MGSEDSGNSCSVKGTAIFVVLIVLLFNSLLLTLMISKSVVINQENQILLERILAVTTNTKSREVSTDLGSSNISQKIDPDIVLLREMENEPLLVESQLPQERHIRSLDDACPPCPTTAPPDPEGHLNPVGILNEVTHTKAKYECVYSCINPVIHVSNLTIDDPDFNGKSWEGIGSSKAKSKHDAAYKALKAQWPKEAEKVAKKNIPLEYNPGPCQKPPKESQKIKKAC